MRWVGEQRNLVEQQYRELAEFRAEAAAVLADRPVDEMPDDVFAGPKK